jgi:hypothetical protein
MHYKMVNSNDKSNTRAKNASDLVVIVRRMPKKTRARVRLKRTKKERF